MNSVGIGIIYYLLKIIVNLILTIIGVAKEQSCLHFYYIIKEKYTDNNTKFYIMIGIMIFLLYQYIIMMACINFLYLIPSLLRRNAKNEN